MQFQPGQSGNPAGRPKGQKSGRMQALGELDAILKDAGTLETLREGLQKSLERDPVWFFRRIIMPLLPKEASLQIENDGVVQWLSLSTTVPTEVSSESTTPATRDSALSVPDAVSAKPSALPENSSTEVP
ncbi:DUF5681 domain-containing protein [Pontiella sulfatireligans]|uniref:DUF5681 domain-containing protein n=1 Tax=Pontiella sulfatireligans TaxID=2750658 RepID=UPI001FE750B4|nr:DUF5681 domain-containing protein [Pontiella sulfatireligans]